MFIHLDQDGKIDDICSRLDGGHKRDETFLDKDYIISEDKDIRIGDTYPLKDALSRFIEPPKTEIELLREEIELLKTRLDEL